jgi:ADP-heptose:LPS heptosyltransferase
LPTYDWVINLRRVAPSSSFLEGTGQTFEEILGFLSRHVTSKVITGCHFQAGRDRSHVNLFHCRTEVEELFLSALPPWTYSIEFVERLANFFASELTVVIVGQANYKSAEDKARYDAFIKSHPNIVDLIDKTNLEKLLYVIKELKLFIPCDSGPLHIATALGVPVIGLYVNAADFPIALG